SRDFTIAPHAGRPIAIYQADARARGGRRQLLRLRDRCHWRRSGAAGQRQRRGVEEVLMDVRLVGAAMMRLTVSTLVFFGALCVGAAAQMPATCPAEIGAADCWSGQDKNGAFYWAAKPKAWNGILVVHAHGGPRVGPIKQDDPVEDLVRFAVMVKAGYAWVGSSYRRGGYGVVMAAEDSDNARAIFVDKIAKPRLVIAHAQSWGGNVMAKLDETPTLAAHYNGVLLTSGVLGGGTRGYDFRIDLRAVYNYYCHNHPAPNEPAYALNIGLPPDSKLTRKDLEERVEQCTGVKLPVSQRSEAQQRALANILKVTRIPERTLQGHMNWA